MTTLLEYACGKLLGPPTRVAGGGESYWPCPSCDAHYKFHTLPHDAAYKHRVWCNRCGFRGDIYDLLKLLHPREDYGRRVARVQGLQTDFDADGAAPPSPRGGARRGKHEQAEVALVWADMTRVEVDEVLSASPSPGELYRGVPLDALADYSRDFIEFDSRTDAAHLRGCTEPDCDARVCRAARGLPPLTPPGARPGTESGRGGAAGKVEPRSVIGRVRVSGSRRSRLRGPRPNRGRHTALSTPSQDRPVWTRGLPPYRFAARALGHRCLIGRDRRMGRGFTGVPTRWPMVTPTRSSTGMGGVLPLASALERFPDAKIVVYHRVSSYGQAGPGRCKLDRKTYAVVGEVRAAAPGRLRAIIRGVEEGRLTCPRKALARAVARAASLPAGMIVAADLSRFVRAGTYDRRTNPEAVPTPDEFAQLRELTQGVPLATLAPPSMSESQRHSLATRRAEAVGRPRSITPELAAAIFRELGWLALSPRGLCWRRSVAKVAREFGVSEQAIRRAAETKCPTGETWRWAAMRRAADLGLHEIRWDELRGYVIVMRFDR